MEGFPSSVCESEGQAVHYLSGCHFIAIGVHGGQDVNACVVDQPHDPLVSCQILLTQKLGELDEELPAQHFIAVHVAHILELWLHWEEEEEMQAALGWNDGNFNTAA